jgi:hypothetical protein
MDLSYFPNPLEVVYAFWWIFIHGGWLAFVAAIIWVLYQLYHQEIQHQFRVSQEWTFLNIKTPRENQMSLVGVEQIYAQLHAMHAGLTWAQKYIEGRTQLWYCLEIVSLGGKISFIIRTPTRLRNLVEAAFYAQYPECEITEVRDYMENVHYDPEKSDFDVFGCELNILQNHLIPIKTYRDFEHPTSEAKIIDPLAPLMEAFNKMEPHEFFAMQIIAQPLADPEWKPYADQLVNFLMGLTPKETGPGGFIGQFMATLAMLNPLRIIDIILGGAEATKEEAVVERNYMKLTDTEKERISAVERKASKPGYLCKIRFLYMAPKDKFDGAKKSVVIGAVRTWGNAQTNGFKPDTKKTWTSIDYRLSPTLEAPYINWEVAHRKKMVIEGYKTRYTYIGLDPFILNVEELATLFHLPLTNVNPSPPVERVEMKKAAAPLDLPVE